ncbi:MAG: bifunctional glycosyltransferase family 2/GtrA family protein [Nitrospirae bacterium]|nr:bifunctional glycosyltransferase family 2/GtrA family protein [Nitrospirota bacterium]
MEAFLNNRAAAEAGDYRDTCILIPAYNPDGHLEQLVEDLIEAGVGHIIVVNDGSSAESAPVFERIRNFKQCHLLTHAVNLGKGRALKTGLNYCYLHFPDSTGVVTADADGQHLSEDILKTAKSLKDNQDKLILGTRSFGKSTPLRSLIGNVITRRLFSFLVGMKISDTQTGLRGIPRKYIPAFLQLDGERYEFEMSMLIAAKEHAIGLKEEPIGTIYIENNRASHFNPLIDSMKIYFLLIRFAFSSFFAASMDLVVFAVSYNFIFKSLLSSIILGRLIASVINFSVNRRIVFHSSDSILKTVIKYYALTASIMVLAFSMISTMVNQFEMNVFLAKVLAEILLFMASFSIQRDFIFNVYNGHDSRKIEAGNRK